MCQELEEYINLIHSYAEERRNIEFLNSGENHALNVFVEIFSHAEHHIRIYAHSLCSDMPNDEKYIETLSDFIEKAESELEIILQEINLEKIINSQLFRRLHYHIKKGANIHIYRTDVIVHNTDNSEAHFTVGDDCMYRVEKDVKTRSAYCNMNDEKFAAYLIKLFEDIKKNEETESVDLLSIMNL